MFLFMAPIVLATVLYAVGYRPLETKQNGELIEPTHELDESRWFSVQGQFKHRWRLLFNAPSPCDEACANTLYMMRQVHTALGKNAPRVQRVWAVDESTDWSSMGEKYPALHIIQGNWPQWMQEKQGVWLVDPMNRVLMFYDKNVPEKGWLQDLKHLLKISKVG